LKNARGGMLFRGRNRHRRENPHAVLDMKEA
jgi:hypothetical protein